MSVTTAPALPPLLPNKAVEQIELDKHHPNCAWRSGMAWLLDSWPGLFSVLLTAWGGQAALRILIAFNAPLAVQLGQILLWLWICRWALLKTPKCSTLFSLYLDDPLPYLALRCELMGIAIHSIGKDDIAVRATWNRQQVTMPLSAARKEPWKALQGLPQMRGYDPTNPRAIVMLALLKKTLDRWQEKPGHAISQYVDYAHVIKAGRGR